MEVENNTVVAERNDVFRKSGTSFTVTNGVIALGDVIGIVDKVRSFNDFTDNNDPHGEHDFGEFSWRGEEIFWKIDYYDKELKYGKDPLDPECNRVLTVLLASEY